MSLGVDEEALEVCFLMFKFNGLGELTFIDSFKGEVVEVKGFTFLVF